MKMIIEVKQKYKGERFPPFIQAAFDENIKDVRILLLEEGMDMNQKSCQGFTALHCVQKFDSDTVFQKKMLQKFKSCEEFVVFLKRKAWKQFKATLETE